MPQPNDTSAPSTPAPSEPVQSSLSAPTASAAPADFSPSMLDDGESGEAQPSASPPVEPSKVASTGPAPASTPAGGAAPNAGGVASASPVPPAAPNAPSWDPSKAGVAAVAETVPAAAPTPSAPAVAPAPSQAPQPEPEAQKLRSDTMAAIAKEYSLSEDEAQQILIAPEKVLPQMAARMHLQIYEDVVRFVVAQMPTIQMDIHGRQQQAAKAEEAFFAAWPALREHKQDVMEAVRLYRAQFPTAEMTKAIQDIGSYVMFKKGLNAPVQAQQAPAQRPATPAMGGGAGSLPPAAPSGNRWNELATEMAEE